MSVGSILLVVAGVIAVGTLLWWAGRWLTGSWEVLDDDQLHQKLTAGDNVTPQFWLTVMSWFGRGPRQLTYRRDERGRFRKTRR